MTKRQLVSKIARNVGISKKEANSVVSTVTDVIHAALSNGKGSIRISDLGTFRVLAINARRGVNPRTGKEMTIPAMRLPRFYPSKSLKEAVKDGE